jgi:hypothetical protein
VSIADVQEGYIDVLQKALRMPVCARSDQISKAKCLGSKTFWVIPCLTFASRNRNVKNNASILLCKWVLSLSITHNAYPVSHNRSGDSNAKVSGSVISVHRMG